MSETDHTTDEQLIALYNARSEDAIALTAKRYGKYLHATAANILQNNEDCDECLNDTYLAVWNSIPPENPRSFKAYITVIVRNHAIDLLKKIGRQKRKKQEDLLPLEELAEYLGCPDTVEKEYSDRVLQDLIDRFIAGLSDKDRYVFECRYYCCDDIESIARSMKMSKAAVYKRIDKMKSALKKALEAGGYDVY